MGPNQRHFCSVIISTYPHLRLLAYAKLQETRVTSVIKMKSETVSSNGCGNTGLHGGELVRSG